MFIVVYTTYFYYNRIIRKTFTMIPSGLDDNIIYLIGEFAKAFNDDLSANLKKSGLDVTGEQYTIMATLWYKDGITQKNISESINRDKTTVSRVIDGMIRKNLLVRTPSQLDKRERLIYLTEKGKSLQKQMVKVGGDLYIKVLKDIPDDEIKCTIEILKKMNSNL